MMNIMSLIIVSAIALEKAVMMIANIRDRKVAIVRSLDHAALVMKGTENVLDMTQANHDGR